MVCYPATKSVPLMTAPDQQEDLEASAAYQETDFAHGASSLPPPEYSSLINSHNEPSIDDTQHDVVRTTIDTTDTNSNAVEDIELAAPK